MRHSKLPTVYHPKAEPCRGILVGILKDARTLAILGWLQNIAKPDPLLPEYTFPRAKIGPVFINSRGVVWNKGGIYWDPSKPVKRGALRDLPEPEKCFPALRRLLRRIAREEVPRKFREHTVARVFLGFVDDLKALEIPDEILTREDLDRFVFRQLRPRIVEHLKKGGVGDY